MTPMYMQFPEASYRVIFCDVLPDGRGLVMNNTIYVPESVAYTFIFMGQVNDTTVKIAVDHAISKLNKFIDNL